MTKTDLEGVRARGPGRRDDPERTMLIEVESLHLAIEGRPILHDVHLHVGEGEIYGLLGPNGAGKSTTIAALLGLHAGAAGHLRVLGQDPRSAPPQARARIGVLPEQNGFYEWMTAARYLSFFASLYGMPEGRAAVADKLDAVGLAANEDQRIGSFSRGMRQRLGLARAMLADPAVVILDEPTNGLDPRGRHEIHDTLIGLARRGVGILLCTHLLDDVERLCDRVGVVVAGRTVAEGRIADLIDETGRCERFRLHLTGRLPGGSARAGHVTVVATEAEWCIVDVDAGTKPEAAWRELMFSGWPIDEIRRDGGGLESLYLALTETEGSER